MNWKQFLSLKKIWNLKPLDYAKVSDEDIVFSYTTWEVIDLNERVNFPFLYPTDVARSLKTENL